MTISTTGQIHCCLISSIIFVADGPAPDEITIKTDLETDTPHDEGTVAPIECTVDNCFPIPDVILTKDKSDLGFKGTGMHVCFEVTLNKTYNKASLSCCAGVSSGEWEECSGDEVVLEVNCECV